MLSKPDTTYSIIVPVYNSETSLTLLIQKLAEVLPALGQNYEVILVNDGSRDRSWQVICHLANRYTWVKGINLMRNYGQHNALLCGIRAAQHSISITIDDDLQNPPEEIHLLLAKLNEGYDVVYGTPQQQQHGFLRDMASEITKIVLQNSMGAATARNVSAFRAFRTDIRKAFVTYQGNYVSIDVLLTWGTTRFSSVVVRHEQRQFGKSNYTFQKLVTHAFNMMTGFSVWPLQIASMLGFLFTLVGIITLVYVLVVYVLRGGSVPGFAFLACSIAMFSGVQLFTLGVIGEYLGRMHFRVMDKPSYVVDTSYASEENDISTAGM